MAFIGIGNRGKSVMTSLVQTGMVNVVALCDVDMGAPHTLEMRKAYPDVPAFQDFRELFDKMGKGFDAVTVATPDHSHFAIAMHAMAHGKHVYVEKPLAHTFEEVELLMAMEKKTGVVTQMGNQGHSGANYFQFKAWTEGGVIKDVTKIDAYMNSPRRWHPWDFDAYQTGEAVPSTIDWDLWNMARPVHPFSETLHPGNWRSWYTYGNGAFGDWGPHILDTAHRFLKLGLPEVIEAEKLDGAKKHIFPMASTIRFDFARRGAMPPVEVRWYDGVDNQPPIPKEMGPNDKLNRNGKIIYSKDLVFKGGTHSDSLRIIPEATFRELAPSLPRFPQKNSNHFANFVLACKGEEEVRSPFSVSGPLTQVFLLGVIAQRLGGRLAFDVKKQRFTNSKQANKLLTGAPPRKGWESYYKV